MKFLSRFIASVLSLVLIASVSAYILGYTIWNPTFIQASAISGHLASKVAEEVPVILKSSLSLTSDEQFIVKTVVTDRSVAPYVDQIVSGLAKADGTLIRLDFSGYRGYIYVWEFCGSCRRAPATLSRALFCTTRIRRIDLWGVL